MQRISLVGEAAGGLSVLVDDEDFPSLTLRRWRLHRGKGPLYAVSNQGSGVEFMHRLILKVESGMEVDHIDGDGLNNQRSNLRGASRTLNLANQKPQVGRSSRYKGVYWYTSRGLWRAAIKYEGVKHHIGYFADEIDAAAAYDRAAVEQWGEFARPNLSGAPLANI
jgi:hypothetical protein